MVVDSEMAHFVAINVSEKTVWREFRTATANVGFGTELDGAVIALFHSSRSFDRTKFKSSCVNFTWGAGLATRWY